MKAGFYPSFIRALPTLWQYFLRRWQLWDWVHRLGSCLDPGDGGVAGCGQHAGSQVCGVSGNMLAARYIRCICWHLPQSVSQLVCRFSHQLLLNISVQHLTSLSMQCNEWCRGCVEEFDGFNILGFFFFKLVYPKYQGWVDWVQYIRDPKYQGGFKLNPGNLDPTPKTWLPELKII